jgi:hypothetical protein
MNSIFLALPHYGNVTPDALPSLMLASQSHRVSLNTNGASLLAHNFNNLWCAALNAREEKQLSHFAMHHADIGAEPGWVDLLIAELDAHHADLISVVIPIKDGRGLTSTGVQDPETLHIRRFTMNEVMDLPETFTAGDIPRSAGRPEHHLMVNTGLWLCRFTEAWIEEVFFEIRDCIVRHPSGRFVANVLPEDWNFSGWCARKGLKALATRKVKAVHHGNTGFSNQGKWGDWNTDLGDQR